MEAFVYFILGAVVSIPIAVFAPFVTSRVQQRQGERSSKQAAKRKQQLLEERAVITRFAANPGEFTHYLLSRVLFITLVTAFTGLVPALITAFAEGFGAYEATTRSFTPGFNSIEQWLFVLSALLGILSTVIIIGIASRAIRTYRNVSHANDYVKSVDTEISRLHAVPGPTDVQEGAPATTSSGAEGINNLGPPNGESAVSGDSPVPAHSADESQTQ